MISIDQDLLLLGQRPTKIFGVDDAVLAGLLASLAEGTATVAAPAAGAASTAALAAPIAAGGFGAEAAGGLGGALSAADATPAVASAIGGETPLGNFVGPAPVGETGGGVAGPASPAVQPSPMDMLKEYLPESLGGPKTGGGGASTPAPNTPAPTLPDPAAKLKGMLNPANDAMAGKVLGMVRKTPPPPPAAGSAQQPQHVPYQGPSALQFLEMLRRGMPGNTQGGSSR